MIEDFMILFAVFATLVVLCFAMLNMLELEEHKSDLIKSAPLVRVLEETNPISNLTYYRPLNEAAYKFLPKRRRVWKPEELLELSRSNAIRVDII